MQEYQISSRVYEHISEILIRSIIPKYTNVIALTATAICKTLSRDTVMKSLNMVNEFIICHNPNKVDINEVQHCKNNGGPNPLFLVGSTCSVLATKISGSNPPVLCQSGLSPPC